MHLSRYTDYAYRVLIYVAVNKKRCTLSEISSQFNISLDHLRKVVHALGKSKYVNTFKGKSGGIELERSPTEINLGDIFRDFELIKEPIINCEKQGCLLASCCRLKHVLFDGQNAFLSELEKYSLQDLLSDDTRYQLLISI